MPDMKITKTAVDRIEATGREYHLWDTELLGFGVRVRESGAATYILRYRAGHGRSAPSRRVVIGAVGKMTPEQARREAKIKLGEVAGGRDPAAERARERQTLTLADLADRFVAEHVGPKRAARTTRSYADVLDRLVKPELGTIRADKVSRADVARLHLKLGSTPFQANRMLATLSALFTWAGKVGLVPEDHNPARRVDRYSEDRRERFLSTDELERLGAALREAETVGIPWELDPEKKTKHVPKTGQTTRIDPFAGAALRLLILTGARLSEVLGLRWDMVDVERGLLLLPRSKTGRKTIVLNAPALAILIGLPRIGRFVIPGDPQRGRRRKDGSAKLDEAPRADLKRPWAAVSKRAGLDGVRIHDLRHTHASIGAAAGLGLPVIGRLLGHTQAATTQRYAHLADDPLRRASDRIGNEIARAMGQPVGDLKADIVPLRHGKP